MNTVMELRREELEGCLQLGLEKQSLHHAGRILVARRISASGFQSAVGALLVCENHLRRWVRRVESGFARLNPQEQREAASQMLSFYVSLNRWDDAARFLPSRPTTAEELLFSMWTLLNLRRMDEASALLKLCRRHFKRTKDEFERSCVLEAAGCLYAQEGSWGHAESASVRGTEFWPFAPNAWERLVKLQALRGLMTANEVFDFVSRARRTHECQSPNAKVPCAPEQLEDLDRDFHHKAAHLAKVIPAKERWHFGL